jgi:hypothetical protein
VMICLELVAKKANFLRFLRIIYPILLEVILMVTAMLYVIKAEALFLLSLLEVKLF